MNKKVYRKRKLVQDYAKAHRVRVAKAHEQVDIIEKVCAALGPLKPFQRNKVWRALHILLEEEPKRKSGFHPFAKDEK